MRPLLLLFPLIALAQTPSFDEVLKLAKSGSPKLPDILKEDRMKKGTAWFAEGPNLLVAVDAPARPLLILDEAPAGKLRKAGGFWYATARLATGRTHNFGYLVNGKPFGGAMDVPAFGPYSYQKPGVPKGKLEGKFVHTSKLYPGMKSDWWLYVPAQYDGSMPAAVMVWQDGEVLVPRESSRNQIVFDNLSDEKKIPVIIHLLVSPGWIGKTRMRSIEYDMMDDNYVRFLRDEIVPEVEAKGYKLRQDAYSRAIAGDSSGGICAFNAGYTHPEYFSRVLSRIGSFTSIQWQQGVIDGGNVYPFKIRKEPKRNIRVWLQDGAGDLENEHGSWPAQNIAMVNSLKRMEYDFHFAWGNGGHSRNGGHAELAEEMIWLWRDYDAAKTEQQFVMDPAEKTKPEFRVKALNRE
jgi:enterochelin esterase family protein